MTHETITRPSHGHAAITQRRCHPEAIEYTERRIAQGNTKAEALRALKRRISDAVFRDLLADHELNSAAHFKQAA